MKPFKPGQSGNPGGRPKGGQFITEVLRRLLDDDETIEKFGKAILSQAARGNGTAMKLVVDRIDGVLPKKIDFEYDFSRLSDDELEVLDQLSLKASTSFA